MFRIDAAHRRVASVVVANTGATDTATDGASMHDGTHGNVETVIAGGRGRVSLDTLRELLAFREVLTAFIARQIKVRYKQALLGLAWAVIQPMAAAALFTVFIGRVAGVSSEGVSYLLFALSGMVCWTYFSNAVDGAMDSLVTDQQLLRKVYFPREILPLASVLSALVDLLPAVGVLFSAVLIGGVSPALTWLAAPIVLLPMVILATGVGVFLAAVNVYYRDVRYALPFLLQLGLFASPVVYSVDAIPRSWRGTYTVFNPVAASIDSLRRTVLHQTLPSTKPLLMATAWSLVLLVAAYTVFKRLERGFADRV